MTSQGQRFRRRALRRGYKVDEVDAFLERVEATVAGEPFDAPVTARDVRDVVFRVRFGGYDEWQVDLHLDRIERQLGEAADRSDAAPSALGLDPGGLPPLPSRAAAAAPSDPHYGRYDDETYAGQDPPYDEGHPQSHSQAYDRGYGPAYGEGYQQAYGEEYGTGYGQRDRFDMTTEMQVTDSRATPHPHAPPHPYGPPHPHGPSHPHSPPPSAPEQGPPAAAPEPPAAQPSMGGPLAGGPGAGPVPPDVQRVDQLRRSFQPRRFGSGYDRGQVDQLFEAVLAGMAGHAPVSVTEAQLDPRQFDLVSGGYFEGEVDQALQEVREILRRR